MHILLLIIGIVGSDQCLASFTSWIQKLTENTSVCPNRCVTINVKNPFGGHNLR